MPVDTSWYSVSVCLSELTATLGTSIVLYLGCSRIASHIHRKVENTVKSSRSLVKVVTKQLNEDVGHFRQN